MQCHFEDGVLTLFISGRIDTLTVNAAEQEALEAIEHYRPDKVICDCRDLVYIASAGLRMLLKIGKQQEMLIRNVSTEVYEVLNLTGFTGMFDTKRIMRELSVDGCKVVGAGFSSTVYRYDRETIRMPLLYSSLAGTSGGRVSAFGYEKDMPPLPIPTASTSSIPVILK